MPARSRARLARAGGLATNLGGSPIRRLQQGVPAFCPSGAARGSFYYGASQLLRLRRFLREGSFIILDKDRGRVGDHKPFQPFKPFEPLKLDLFFGGEEMESDIRAPVFFSLVLFFSLAVFIER